MADISFDNRIESPHRKRLLISTNPSKTDVSSSPESTVESPHLSDCHCCSVRINCTNPRERLQPMESMWRIVLLCKKCFKLVNSSELCSYCFNSVDDVEDCFKCSDCERSIHKECATRCGSVLGLLVCVDCWIPDAFVSSVRARKRKVRKRSNECCEQADTLCEVSVSVGEYNERSSVEKEVERKVAVAAKATENAVRKAVTAKNAVELAKGVLSVVAGSGGELAVLLHRAISSSPRISRYACFGSSFRRDDAVIACYSRRCAGKKIVGMDSSTLDGPLLCYSRRGKSCFRNSVSLNAPLLCYSRGRWRSKACSYDRECECFSCKTSEKTDEHVSIPSAYLKACNHDSDLQNRYNGNNGQGNDVRRIAMKPHRSLLKYYRIGKGTKRPLFFVKDSDCSYINSADLCTDGMTGTRNIGNGYECHEICEKFDDNANRFLLKYRRNLRSKPESSSKINKFSPMLPSNHLMESTVLSDATPCSSSQAEL
ncbi:putative transcription factor interactor and regulator LIM family [Helianthus debilis subsp. tardiflorus]